MTSSLTDARRCFTAHPQRRAVLRWVFDGCSCERDLAAVIRAAGFASVEIDQYRLRSPFLPANTQIAGTAIA
jgi:hypothetical protein